RRLGGSGRTHHSSIENRRLPVAGLDLDFATGANGRAGQDEDGHGSIVHGSISSFADLDGEVSNGFGQGMDREVVNFWSGAQGDRFLPLRFRFGLGSVLAVRGSAGRTT